MGPRVFGAMLCATAMDAVPQVEIRPSVEFNIERARARLKSLPLPPTLKHASDADRELYMRTIETLENAASVRRTRACTHAASFVPMQ